VAMGHDFFWIFYCSAIFFFISLSYWRLTFSFVRSSFSGSALLILVNIGGI